MHILEIDWASMFAPHHSLLDNVLRGTLIYFGLLLALRLVRNRSTGGLSVSDLLLVTLTANALQNSLVGKGDTLTEGAVSTATVFFWSYAFDWLGYRFAWLHRLLHSVPELVIRDGAVIRSGLRREMLTDSELAMHLRLAGLPNTAAVKEAYIEENGAISIILKERA